MSNGCACGHEPSSHYGNTGACEHISPSIDGQYWFYDCHCPHYEKDCDD
jgi:hypothetical protein